MSWFLKALKNYAGFSGRSQRKEYWFFFLFYFIFLIVAMIIDGVTGLLYVVTGLLGLALLIPTLSVTCRRLHDTGRTGWWQLLLLVPFGGIVIIIFMCLDSHPEENKYGLPVKV